MGHFVRVIVFVFLAAISQSVLAAPAIKILTKNPQQGSMILGQVQNNSEKSQVSYKGKLLPIDQQGYFVFGVGRDAPAKISLLLKQGKTSETLDIAITKRQWKIERVDGLPPGKVSPRKPAVLKRIATETKQVKKARATVSVLSGFKMPFILPAKGRISGVYGSQRVLNGKPKRPHYGLDVANKVGTPVIAPASGVVTLVHKDMFYSGGTLIIDHGHGISSTYIHLNSIEVKQGDLLAQGQLIATIGATGRATGPHLDWRLNWLNTRLDPQLLLPKKESKQANKQ